MGCPTLLRKSLAIWLVLLGLLLATMAGSQKVKRYRNATITAQTMELDWDTNVAEFSRNCQLNISGDYSATMTAPNMVVRLTPEADKVVSVVAKGPVSFSIVTKPDAKGIRRRITASARQEATYSEDTQVIKLVGGAQADMLPVGAAEGTEAVHFTGQTIAANLKTNRLTVDEANLTIKTETE